jgi:hypothetical protein
MLIHRFGAKNINFSFERAIASFEALAEGRETKRPLGGERLLRSQRSIDLAAVWRYTLTANWKPVHC